jgi:hypothetical protein
MSVSLLCSSVGSSILRSVNHLIRSTLCSLAVYILLLHTWEVSGSVLGLESAILTGLMFFFKYPRQVSISN